MCVCMCVCIYVYIRVFACVCILLQCMMFHFIINETIDIHFGDNMVLPLI